MAGTATMTPTVTDQWFDGHRLHVLGTVALTGGTDYASGGLVMSFAGLVKGSSRPPEWLTVKGISGFIYEWVVGTTQATGKVQIRVEATVATNTPLAQHSAVAVVSGVTGDTIVFYGIFPYGR